jgi:hypothetical protein
MPRIRSLVDEDSMGHPSNCPGHSRRKLITRPLRLLHSTCHRPSASPSDRTYEATTECRLLKRGAYSMLEPDAGPTRTSGS